MASMRPSLPRSSSYQRSYHHKEDSLRPHKHEHRSRSTSRTPPTRLYDADAPRRYAPNESRARKPPLKPTIEDIGTGPDGVQMRGKPDQTPMIMNADESSSDESDGSMTPDSSIDDGQDSRFHGLGVKGQQGAPSGKKIQSTKPAADRASPKEEVRGRRQGLTVDTEAARSVSAGNGPPPNLERARSPYSFRASSPKSRPRIAKDERGSGECMLSPEPLTPRLQHPRKPPNFQPHQQPPARANHVRQESGGSNSALTPAQSSPTRPLRPSIARRASAMPQLGSPPAASASRSRYVENSSDDSDREYARIRSRSGQFTAEPVSGTSSYFETPRQNERLTKRAHPNSPPRTPLSPEHTRSTFLNREALLSGQGLQHLSTLLEDQQSHPRRVASPRPSPQPSPRASPTPSPYPSPPRTPPERHHRRSNTVESLKKDSPSSKPGSPLTSRPSSPKPAAQTFTARPMDQDGPRIVPLTKERRTSTWDAAEQQKADSLQGPRIDSRAATQVPPPRHDRKASYEKNDAYNQPRYPANVGQGQVEATLQPARHHHRQRSSSDLRAGLPALSTKTPASHQGTDPSTAPTARSRQSGPYMPASASATMKGASLLEPGASGGRSRSIAPGASQHQRHRSRSRAGSDARTTQRARSTAPNAPVPASDQTQPVLLPQCPRPEPVAGFDDWYSLERDPTMAICPDCRHNVFGRGYERAFIPHTEPKRGQKIHCAMNDPWVRLACLDAFTKKRKLTSMLRSLAEVSNEEPPCPEHRLSEECDWYHVRDSETGRDFQDFQVCSHCVCSLDIIYGDIGDIFIASKNLKKEPRSCSLRSDVHRLGKYLNALVAMADEAKRTGVKPPPTSDFIWEVKLLTVIDKCKGDEVHYGQDMHSHPDLPELTICEECYYKQVRPILKATPRDSRHFVRKISPDAKEIVGGASCKLYSPRMKQIFKVACEDGDWKYLEKAVKKRNDLQQDLEEAKMIYHKKPQDLEAKAEMEYLLEKWKKLERRHD